MKKKVAIISSIAITLIIIVTIFICFKNKDKDIPFEELNKYSEVEDIKFEKNKVNVYFFWGEGCPHCKAEYEFLESVYKKYYKNINIYSLEVWDNSSNSLLMSKFLYKLDDDSITPGVPLLVVGDEVLSGFYLGELENDSKNEVEQIIKRQIKKQVKQKNKYDIYKLIKGEENER